MVYRLSKKLFLILWFRLPLAKLSYMRKLSLLFILFLFGITVFAQKEDSLFIKLISDEILANGKAYDNLHDLTKNIGGRLSGSPQMYKAEAWGLQTLLQSGADKIWMQECMVPQWIRGGPEKAVVKRNLPVKGSRKQPVSTKQLDIIGLGNSMGTGPDGINADVIEVSSFDDLEAKKDSVKGKIVFYNYKFNPTFVNTFQSYGDANKYRGQGPSRAAKYGAVAVIVRSMSHSTDNNPHTGATRYDTAYKKIPAVAIGLQDADWLDLTLQKERVSVLLNTNGHFLPDTIGHNVIGELRGSEFPDQYITVGGHLDSWDPAEGASDDGTGVVQTIEILRAFKALGYTPKHTIRFVLFANEENGLKGGSKYAEEAKANNEKHIFALESDAGGFTPRGFGFNANDEQVAKAKKWSSLLAPYGGSTLVKGGDGADIGPLQRAYNI